MKEYEEAFNWYRKNSVIAADKMVLEFGGAMETICKHPDRHRNAYKNFHEFSLKKYPYKIIYIINEDRQMIIIVSFYHYKRHPRNKYK